MWPLDDGMSLVVARCQPWYMANTQHPHPISIRMWDKTGRHRPYRAYMCCSTASIVRFMALVSGPFNCRSYNRPNNNEFSCPNPPPAPHWCTNSHSANWINCQMRLTVSTARLTSRKLGKYLFCGPAVANLQSQWWNQSNSQFNL